MKKGMMMTCKDATELVVKGKVESLSRWDRFRLRFHLSMCKFCGLFEKQNKIIDNSLKNIDQAKPTDMPDGTKVRILSNLEK